ncbi:LytR/AlgR family response regulator transcription factor [Fibrella aestuarina]|nr:LytTR family DNA-binding domain-containing protein [Fibrella aestuarina]
MIHICHAPVASPQPVRPIATPIHVPKLSLPFRNQLVQVAATDIVWLEGASNYTFIHTRDKRRYLVAKNLKRLEADLVGSPFCRVHKSTLVNLTYLLDVRFGDEPHLHLKNGQTISISRRRITSTRRQIRAYQAELTN